MSKILCRTGHPCEYFHRTKLRQSQTSVASVDCVSPPISTFLRSRCIFLKEAILKMRNLEYVDRGTVLWRKQRVQNVTLLCLETASVAKTTRRKGKPWDNRIAIAMSHRRHSSHQHHQIEAQPSFSTTISPPHGTLWRVIYSVNGSAV